MKSRKSLTTYTFIKLQVVHPLYNINILISIKRRGLRRFRPAPLGDACAPNRSVARNFESPENVCIGHFWWIQKF